MKKFNKQKIIESHLADQIPDDPEFFHELLTPTKKGDQAGEWAIERAKRYMKNEHRDPYRLGKVEPYIVTEQDVVICFYVTGKKKLRQTNEHSSRRATESVIFE